MSQDRKVTYLSHRKKEKQKTLSNKEKLVYAYHYLEQGEYKSAYDLIGNIDQSYFLVDLHKDIARALLCYATYRSTQNDAHFKEAEFYLVIYRLTKRVVAENLLFTKSGYFQELRHTLFKDFQL